MHFDPLLYRGAIVGQTRFTKHYWIGHQYLSKQDDQIFDVPQYAKLKLELQDNETTRKISTVSLYEKYLDPRSHDSANALTDICTYL